MIKDKRLKSSTGRFCILIYSIKFKATYMTQTIPNCRQYAKDYDKSLEEYLICLFQKRLNDRLILQASMPIGTGGIGLNIDPSKYCEEQYRDSENLTYHIVRNITHGDPIQDIQNSRIRKNLMEKEKRHWAEKLNYLVNMSEESQIIRLNKPDISGTNALLNHIPIGSKANKLLPKYEFSDAMNLRFNSKPDDLTFTCPYNRCLESFTLNHADICNKRWTAHRRHDYLKTIFATHGEKAFRINSVAIEPMLGKIDGGAKDLLTGNLENQARGELVIRDFQLIHSYTVMEIRVLSPTCDSNKNMSIQKCISNAKNLKNKKYADRIKTLIGCNFIPGVVEQEEELDPQLKCNWHHSYQGIEQFVGEI